MLISVQAGNSDNKLTQQLWSDFVACLNQVLERYQTKRHFFGGSVTWAKWQNVCWVVEIEEDDMAPLRKGLAHYRELYFQDSVCVLTGVAEFV